MNNLKVSVIIPVYNVEKYLAETLDSAINQSLKDIEIICVNDGSTDGSGSILQKYSDKDDRIRVINQPNGGLSRARNAGIGSASGKYIYFLDGDDLIEKDAMESLYERAEQDTLDILLFDAKSFCDDKGVTRNKVEYYDNYYIRSVDYPGVMSGVELMCRMFCNKEYRQSSCLQFFRREFLKATGNLFPEGVFHEDNIFTFRGLLAAEKAGYLHRTLYHRRMRSGSIVTLSITGKHVYGYYVNYLGMRDALINSPSRDNPVLWKLLDEVLHNVRYEYSRMDRDKDIVPEMGSADGNLFKTQVVDYVDKPCPGFIKRFAACLRDNGLRYTLKHTVARIRKRLASENKTQESK